MIDISVFKSLLKRETFNTYKDVIFNIPSMEVETRSILNSIRSYFNTYAEQDIITVDELKLHFTNTNPVIKSPENYSVLMDRLYDADINNVELLVIGINKLAQSATANLILQECITFVNKPSDGGLSIVTKHMDHLEQLTKSVVPSEADVCKMSLDELIAEDSAENGLNWRLPFLQHTIGPLKPGTLAHIFAYSEVGKTSLGISELVNFAQQIIAPDCLLFLSNEEAVKRTKFRSYSALCGVEKSMIVQYRDRANELWEEHVGEKIKYIDDCRTMDKIERYINDFKPRLVMIDQGMKVDIKGDLSDVKRLQQIYNIYRRLAVNNDIIIITLGQAEASCAYKKFLGLHNMDMSKVGVPGELDVAIGLGRSDDEGHEFVRYLSVCKNKLTGSSGRGQVSFDYKKCLWTQGDLP